MYPRNNATPEPIAIGAVIQISDGAVQTSGVSVRIRSGGSESAGAGSIGYSTDGVVLYTPTQSETNVSSFILIASKAGCFPVAFMVVTTDAATPGRVRLDGVTHSGAVIPTVSTVTDKAGYGLSTSERSTLVTLIDSTLLDAGDATDLIASIVTRIGNTNVDEAAFVAAVKAALFDAGSAANKLSVDASGRVTANVDAWDGQPVDLDSDNYPVVSVFNFRDTSLSSWLPLHGRLATILTNIDTIDNFVDTEVAAIKTVTDKMDTMLVIDGAVWQLTTNSLENAPAGGGGGSGDASQATLLLVKAKTDLINAGTVTVNSPTTATGAVRPIVIGDDYLSANGRAFTWTIPAVTGVTAGTAQVYFGGTSATDSFLAGPGTATDNGNGTWTLSVDMPRAISSLRKEEQYEWTVGVQAAGGNKITPVRWGERLVFVESHTW